MEKTPRFPGGEKSVESCHVSGCHGFPKESFKAIFGNNLTRIFSLVLKGIFRALLKITLENKSNL